MYYVIMRNTWPLEVFKGDQEEAEARMNKLHADYCQHMNVRPAAVYYHYHCVPFVEQHMLDIVNGEDDGTERAN